MTEIAPRRLIIEKSIDLKEGMTVTVNWQGRKVPAEILALSESNQQTESDPEVQQPSQKNDVERPNKSTKVKTGRTKLSATPSDPYQEFLAEEKKRAAEWGLFDYTPAAKKKVPSKNLVLRWLHEAWREISVEMVAKSFKTCGISNSLDGTEDDKLYTEEVQEIDDNEEDNEFETESEAESDGE
ncbi:unnamed protein product [Porites lobata]|uniref:Uncharacterized protein n=1 Tax=Porites lobata TaxID=104759 RepID=A0ABN8Q2J0_9CNID|nr:unnamed protein product [Porites lobata]